jgi:hypothetical protein
VAVPTNAPTGNYQMCVISAGNISSEQPISITRNDGGDPIFIPRT